MRPSNRVGDDTGAATVLAAFGTAALIATTMGAVWVGAAVAARHRAQAAADLAALAAARQVAAGPATACREAARVGEAMAATVRGCEVAGLDVVVTVGVRTAGPFAGEAVAVARAGPV